MGRSSVDRAACSRRAGAHAMATGRGDGESSAGPGECHRPGGLRCTVRRLGGWIASSAPVAVAAPDKYRVYSNPTNRARMYRVSQFLNSSDRIFHVGTNWASSPAWRARSSGPAAYKGIDLGERYLEGVRRWRGQRPQHPPKCRSRDHLLVTVVTHVTSLSSLTRAWENPPSESMVAMTARCNRGVVVLDCWRVSVVGTQCSPGPEGDRHGGWGLRSLRPECLSHAGPVSFRPSSPIPSRRARRNRCSRDVSLREARTPSELAA